MTLVKPSLLIFRPFSSYLRCSLWRAPGRLLDKLRHPHFSLATPTFCSEDTLGVSSVRGPLSLNDVSSFVVLSVTLSAFRISYSLLNILLTNFETVCYM